ncbi:hypothetical protein ADH70_019330 [Blautia pseudococcoides]|uniref:Uncharacterized protein n=1 Tax=Blautia pseudococcoides TaxID=1796616 RepID=A0A1C7IED7_9FIRM|nr:hypothetical protein A4V09_20715 [Blautia pseudococcoides]ASU30753.1 hypothetical protein ADH70_019330 [Blautia pseudococcoides]
MPRFVERKIKRKCRGYVLHHGTFPGAFIYSIFQVRFFYWQQIKVFIFSKYYRKSRYIFV